MENASGFDISINLDLLFVIPAILLLTAITIYAYRYTIPAISSQLKVFLIVIRSVVLILIVLLIFEPTVIRNISVTEEPVNYIFVDNSSSIVHKDSSAIAEKINNSINRLSGDLSDRNEFYLFGKKAMLSGENSARALSFSDNFTCLESVVNETDSSNENIANIILITDGIFNTGSIPLARIENAGIPFNVIAVGDTSAQQDIQLKNISTNNYIYTDKETMIEAVILNSGFDGKTINSELLVNNKLTESKNVVLDKSGINRILFKYTPTDPGEIKLTIRNSAVPGEITVENNIKTIYRDVLDSKIKIGLISDSPSADYEFIKNAIQMDENTEVVPIVSIKKEDLTAANSAAQILDSLDVLVFTGYPVKNTSGDKFNSVKNTLGNTDKPFLILVSPSTDLKKLSELTNVLPFTIPNSRLSFEKSQVSISDKMNSLLQVNSKFNEDDWVTLPPVKAVSNNIIPKADAQVVATSRIKNIPTGVPLLITRATGKLRSVAILGHEIWRWQLQGDSPELFNQFISNIISWLKVSPDAKKFKLTTQKKVYSIGEDIEFTAELYDEKLAPVLDAEIKIALKSDDNVYDLFLSLNEAGKYTGTTTAKSEGDLKFYCRSHIKW